MLMLPKKIFLLILLFALTACNKPVSKVSGPKIITVTIKPNISTLYFTSTVQPLKTYAVTAPYDGAVINKYFDYGAPVQKGQLLLEINSSQLENDYQSALTEYLKAKKNYANDLFEMRNTEELKKLQIISRDDYIRAKSTSYDTELSYQQSIYKLQGILNKSTSHPIDLQKLQTADMQKINKILPARMYTYAISAPALGVALMPGKSTDSGGGSAVQQVVNLGSQVKTNQELLNIGDVSGVSFVIKVDEIHINDIKKGQQAIITGDAFPDYELQGVVTHVDEQAAGGDNSSSAPFFPVKIAVAKLTATQQKIIHVGMSAKVALKVEGPANVQLPLSAVGNEKGQAYVKKIDSQTGKAVKIQVQTGNTTMEDITIISGLKSGDKVYADYAAD